MTVKTISNAAYVNGYTLNPKYSGLFITHSGAVGGAGVTLDDFGSVTNYGTVSGNTFGTAVYLKDGGEVANYGTIHSNDNGIILNSLTSATNTIKNSGTVSASYSAIAFMSNYGTVVNYLNGKIDGGYHGIATNSFGNETTIINFGVIETYLTSNPHGPLSGILVYDDSIINKGTITSAGDGIESQLGRGGGSVRLTNSGSISGGDIGVFLQAASSVHNAAGGIIVGGIGVEIADAPGTVTNLGNIESGSTPRSPAVYLEDGGVVVNGAATQTSAILYSNGGPGVLGAGGPATVTNYGTISSFANDAVNLSAGSVVVNGAAPAPKALISGVAGLYIASDGTVSNLGTITGTDGAGVDLGAGGVLFNGESGTYDGKIDGYFGAALTGVKARNYGAILGTGATASGVVLDSGSYFANGASGDKTIAYAYVHGTRYGVITNGGGNTVVNYGVIGGGRGSVKLTSATDTLVAESGAVFNGAIYGGDGTLDLNSGAKIANLSMGGATLALPGSKATVADFGTINLQAGSTFALSGPGSVDAGFSLNDPGDLKVYGTLTVGGTLTIDGTLAGAGTLAIGGGAVHLENGPRLAIADVTEAGAGSTVSVLDGDLAYAGQWTQNAGTLSVATGDRLDFTGLGDTFAGTLDGGGAIELARGTDALAGTTVSVELLDIGAATVTLSGTIAGGGDIASSTPSLLIAAAGATLTGGGALNFDGKSTNAVTGVTAAATLENVNDRIIGAGQLGNGSLTLINDKAGLIDSASAFGLVINTGANTIVNAGVIEDTGTGALTIYSPIDNTGTIIAAKGYLSVVGAVSGAGTLRIEGGLASFQAAFKENVAFTAAGGELRLAHAQAYAGAIAGFSKTGATSLDLEDIGFSGATKATYRGTTTSGVLTVTDGTHTAKIKLTGDYLGSAFTLSSDGADHPGTLIRDTTPAAPAHAFIAAMAGLGAGGGSGLPASPAWRPAETVLAMPG